MPDDARGVLPALALAALMTVGALPPRSGSPTDCAHPIAPPVASPASPVVRCQGDGQPPAGPLRLLLGRRIDPGLAEAATLEVLPGIGPVRAAAVVAGRERIPLCGPADLERIPGIGPRTARRLAPSLEFGGDPRCRERRPRDARESPETSSELAGCRSNPPPPARFGSTQTPLSAAGSGSSGRTPWSPRTR